MKNTIEHDALTNMARGLNLTIHQYHESDRRKKHADTSPKGGWKR